MDQDGTAAPESDPIRDNAALPASTATTRSRKDHLIQTWPAIVLCLGVAASLAWTGMLFWMALAILRWAIE